MVDVILYNSEGTQDTYYDVSSVTLPTPEGGEAVFGLGGGSDLPEGGTVGQILTKTEEGIAWQDAPSDNAKQDKISTLGLLSGDGNGNITAVPVISSAEIDAIIASIS